MGQHTWFFKDRNIYQESISLEEDDLSMDDKYRDNESEWVDCFRTFKTTDAGNYIEDKLYSYEETMQWIEDNKDVIYWSHTMFDTDEQIASYRRIGMENIKKFWDKYPNGIITFG